MGVAAVLTRQPLASVPADISKPATSLLLLRSVQRFALTLPEKRSKLLAVVCVEVCPSGRHRRKAIAADTNEATTSNSL
jgi:hypothetical protein